MLINRKLIICLVVLAVAINAVGIFEPLLRNDDPVLYANIAKHIVLSGDWIDLVSGGKDWLDKPHLPFWISALSFKLFGINSFAYVFPGFLFHLLGAYYTYRLAKHLYNSEVGLISVLLYTTSLHLLFSAIDVRAEAYLLGQIMPACYYWLCYDRKTTAKALLLACLFTAMALMTKGLFVVVTIFSGVFCSWLYTRQFKRIYAPKWLLAYGLCLLFILPELICLYLQFDLHPEKTVFGQQQISGLKWYFWDSQFGRFFNNGPIVNTQGNPFFFVHTFLWAFLPWSMIFIFASWRQLRDFRLRSHSQNARVVYLLASFWLTFIMFSATRFQLDHYTNIIIPFASIVCAAYLQDNLQMLRKLASFQRGLSLFMLIMSAGLFVYLFRFTPPVSGGIIAVILIALMFKKTELSYLEQCLVYPSLAIVVIFGLVLSVNYYICRSYDVGYNVAQQVNNLPPAPLYDMDYSSTPLEFHLKYPYWRVDDVTQLPKTGNYYVFLKRQDWLDGSKKLNKFQYAPVIDFCGATIDKVLRAYNNYAKLQSRLTCYTVLKHE